MIKDLNRYNRIFFIGIGGISMSSLALLLKGKGKTILGSDINVNDKVEKLKNNGIKIFIGHKSKNIKNVDLVVFSGAINDNNPELQEAKKQHIDILERSELLGLIACEYKNVIAISGTHGKTTTTAMISYIFMLCGLNPTIHIGGDFEFINGNLHIGSNDYFITEACEFRDSFLRLKPTVSVVTNIEREHLDYFKSYNNEKKSFLSFANNTKKVCIINKKNKEIFQDYKKIFTFGFSNKSDLFAKNLKVDDDNKYNFECYDNIEHLGIFKLNIFGKHNIENALATIAVCRFFKIDYNFIYLGLKTFENVKRRFEVVGNYKYSLIIHDYAHHPTEIKNAIKTCKDVFKKKIICIFQPHTFSRTKSLIKKFENCFQEVDTLYLINTYSAREAYDYKGSVEYLKERIKKVHSNIDIKGPFSLNDIKLQIEKENFENDILLFLGAGDIEKITRNLIKKR